MNNADTRKAPARRGAAHGNDRLDVLAIDAVQLGRLLGLSMRTIRRLDSSGRIPRPVRIGGAVRWRASEIAEWLSAGCPDRQAWEAVKRNGR